MDIVRRDTERLYKNVVKYIQNLIKEGALSPGDHLLSERQLSEKLGVSRTAIREALTALETMGIVEIIPGGGGRIKKASLAEAVEPLASIIVREKESIEHLIEVRMIFEVAVARLAAIRATEVDLANLKNCLAQLEQDILNGLLTDESDPKFHQAIVQATHNPLLVEMMGILSGLMKEPFGPTRAKMLREQPALLLDLHRNLADAIIKHDPDLAAYAAEKVLEMVQKELVWPEEREINEVGTKVVKSEK